MDLVESERIIKVSFTQINNTVNRTYSPHICIGNYSIHHDWIVPGSSLI